MEFATKAVMYVSDEGCGDGSCDGVRDEGCGDGGSDRVRDES